MQKYKYIVSPRPTPMLAYYQEQNKQIWEEKYEHEFGKYSSDNHLKHWWNIGSYLIVDEEKLQVVAYKYNEISHLIWLLRIISKELIIHLDENEIGDLIGEEFKKYRG